MRTLHAPGRAWLRRATIATVAGFVAATGTTMALAAPHKGSAGSGFGSINISAISAGVRAPVYSNGGEEVAAEAPYSEAILSSGMSGRALTTVFWPGGTGGNGGSTLYTATNGCPVPNVCLPQQDFQALNDPMKAQAQSGVGKPVDTNTKDGVAQQAIAKPTLVSANTVVKASKVPQVSESFGTTSATSVVRVSGPKTAIVTAASSLRDVKLAGGVMKIASITSVARATSNTVTGTGSATTTVSGATIAGIPVTIDSNGVHVKGQGSKSPSAAAVNKALKRSGMQIFVAKPTKTISGANVSVDAGDLVLLFQQSQYVAQGNDTGTLLVLGGASIVANTGKGFRMPAVKTPTTPTTNAGTPAGGAPPSSTGGGAAAGGTGSVPGTGSTVPNTGQQPAVAANPRSSLAASAVHLLSGYGMLWLALGLVLAVGLAAALRRLPDRVLEAPATACPLEDSP